MNIHELSRKLATAGVNNVVVAADSDKFKIPALSSWNYDDGLAAEYNTHIWEYKPVRNHRVTISLQTRKGQPVSLGSKLVGVAKVSSFNIPDRGSWYLVAHGDKYTFSRSGKEAVFNDTKEALSAFKEAYDGWSPSSAVTSAFGKKETVQTPEGWDDALESFKKGVEDLIERYNKANDFKQSQGSKISSEDAQKYTKVFVNEPHGNKRIYCFIERSTGDILKPATYAVPAKGARGNIFDADHGMKRMGSHGPAYNK